MRGMKAKEFYGDRYVSASLEHNFGEIIPGMLRIDNIAEFGVEFITYFNTAFSQFGKNARFSTKNNEPIIPLSTDLTNDKIYYEAGLGLNRLFIFFRTDLTVRFTQRKTPMFVFTFTN